MNIRPAVTEFIHADRRREGLTDGQTHVTKLSLFRNFTKASKNPIFMHAHIFSNRSDYPELYNTIFHPLKLR